ncbi:MAG: 7-carboxy-7-deazaguanine synthase QueE [Phycisphaerae bacterium]|nr:7-carboxy-7-deazaguanine synthase QueE [Phycisphaerae bacterium]
MKISEIFYSLQGEGQLAGKPSVFIRLSGCPLRCRWCDTKYALDPDSGIDYSTENIVTKTLSYNTDHVVITGGEPMINPGLITLTKKLKSLNKHITIETSAIKYQPNLACDLMSISPKLSNSAPLEKGLAKSHNARRINTEAAKALLTDYDCQLKFVVDSPDDIFEIKDFLKKIAPVDNNKVMLMPQAANRTDLLEKSPLVAELCKETGFTFSQRLHILLWNNTRGI